ncbi:MAG: hypothetical protein JXA83_01535 [Acidimicrobiales bacterium]|nr:hypothetical protein [Acidimicrobiales bacterium]
MSSDRREPPRGERVPPELALARLELRQICLLAVHPMLTAAERQVFGAEHQRALAEARVVLERHATRHEGGVDDVARMFIGLYHVYPNLGLVGPFFDDDARPLKEMAWIAAYDSVLSGVCLRAELHARLWDHICDEDRRAVAARRYARDRSLHSFPPSADARAIARYCRRIDTLMASAECVPALLATWAIERHSRRFDDLATADLKDKHGLLEQRHMARFMGMKPNTLAQSLKRFRARLGEEMRVLWNIEKTAADDEDDDR